MKDMIIGMVMAGGVPLVLAIVGRIMKNKKLYTMAYNFLARLTKATNSKIGDKVGEIIESFTFRNLLAPLFYGARDGANSNDSQKQRQGAKKWWDKFYDDREKWEEELRLKPDDPKGPLE